MRIVQLLSGGYWLIVKPTEQCYLIKHKQSECRRDVWRVDGLGHVFIWLHSILVHPALSLYSSSLAFNKIESSNCSFRFSGAKKSMGGGLGLMGAMSTTSEGLLVNMAGKLLLKTMMPFNDRHQVKSYRSDSHGWAGWGLCSKWSPGTRITRE